MYKQSKQISIENNYGVAHTTNTGLDGVTGLGGFEIAPFMALLTASAMFLEGLGQPNHTLACSANIKLHLVSADSQFGKFHKLGCFAYNNGVEQAHNLSLPMVKRLCPDSCMFGLQIMQKEDKVSFEGSWSNPSRC